MQAYQKKVLAFLLRECHEAWRESSCDEDVVEGLTLEEREVLTKELYQKWDEMDEYQGPNKEFSISSLCDLAEDWLTLLPEEQEEKIPLETLRVVRWRCTCGMGGRCENSSAHTVWVCVRCNKGYIIEWNSRDEPSITEIEPE